MAAGAHPIMGTALHAFEATEATHITLSCGQRVRIIEERDDGWSYGEADQTGERGIFPMSYVQPDGLDGAHAETSSLAPIASLRSRRDGPRCQTSLPPKAQDSACVATWLKRSAQLTQTSYLM